MSEKVVSLPAKKFKELEKKAAAFDILLEYEVTVEDILDLLLIHKTRKEKSISLSEYTA